jgi:hypothetical protein
MPLVEPVMIATLFSSFMVMILLSIVFDPNVVYQFEKDDISKIGTFYSSTLFREFQ